jgi:hypothetical protein
MFKWFNEKKAERGEKMLQLLAPGGVGVLSAACCHAGAKPLDEALLADLRAAGVGTETIKVETITEAQQALPAIMGKLDERQINLVQTITTLFMKNGLSVFPMLLVDGQLAFYGGSPGKDAIVNKLNQGGCHAAQ